MTLLRCTAIPDLDCLGQYHANTAICANTGCVRAQGSILGDNCGDMPLGLGRRPDTARPKAVPNPHDTWYCPKCGRTGYRLRWQEWRADPGGTQRHGPLDQETMHLACTTCGYREIRLPLDHAGHHIPPVDQATGRFQCCGTDSLRHGAYHAAGCPNRPDDGTPLALADHQQGQKPGLAWDADGPGVGPCG
jgi:hypothetical protein